MNDRLEPVEPTNPKIQEIAAWAVKEHNKKQGTCLEYVNVVLAGQENVARGMMYYIDLVAVNGGLASTYFAKVFESWTQTRKLEEFKRIPQDNARIAVAN